MKTHPCILTLDPSIGIITNPKDIVAYIIRQFFGTPGKISDVFTKGEIISFREIKALFNTEVEGITTNVQRQLEKVLNRLLPYENVKVECKLINKQSDNRYDLQISIMSISNTGDSFPILTTANVGIRGNEFVINLKGD